MQDGNTQDRQAARLPVVRNVIFDLGGVLLDWSPDRILNECFDEPAVRQRVRRDVFCHPDWQELDRGTLLEAEAADRFSRRCGRSRQEMAAIFHVLKHSLLPIDGTIRLLEDLHACGVPLFCLSNMTEACATFLRRQHAFFGRFRGVVISAAVKMIKPDPAIFRHAIETFGISPGQTVFIDDLAHNVEGARQAGLHAIQFLSPEDCRAKLMPLLNGMMNHRRGAEDAEK